MNRGLRRIAGDQNSNDAEHEPEQAQQPSHREHLEAGERAHDREVRSQHSQDHQRYRKQSVRKRKPGWNHRRSPSARTSPRPSAPKP